MTGFLIGIAVGVAITYIGMLIGEWKANNEILLQDERAREKWKQEVELQKQRNSKVRFYVARDSNGTLRLFLDKPTLFRNSTWYATKKGMLVANNETIELYGLRMEDYASLSFKDEPVEVEITLEGGDGQ